jgi:amino acid transporter
MPGPDSDSRSSAAAPKRQLTLYDSTCIIVGIIIGAGIYESTPVIAQNVASPAWLVGVWLLGGLVSLIGALCYAELATAYPTEGGDYVYLTRAFGRAPGFLFAWAQLWVVRPGSIGAMAYVFARYANELVPLAGPEREYLALLTYAAASVVVLSAVNVLGVREGKWTQNLLTTTKVLGLGAVVLVGLWVVAPEAAPAKPAAAASGFNLGAFGLAMIFVLFTYGGWNEMAYVGAELRDPNRNVLRSLVLGTVSVTAIYVLVTLAFLHALGLGGIRGSGAVAVDMLEPALGQWGGKAISLLICVSALGAVNGQIFTGGRIYYAMGTEHRLYARLGRWSPRLGTPVASLVVQAAITLGLVVGFGMWTKGGFQSMVEFTTPIFWTFFLLVGLSLFALRRREPDTPRPYRVPLYPVVPILFCLSSAYMLYASLSYAIQAGSYEPIWAVVLMLAGVVLSLYDPEPKRA